MDKHQLAQELRQRQYELGIIEKWIVDAFSDDDIIDSYITCSDCGEKQAIGQNLDTIIHASADADQFFQRCDDFAKEQQKENPVGVWKAKNPRRRRHLRIHNE